MKAFSNSIFAKYSSKYSGSPTKGDVKFWFKFFNENIFDNKLTMFDWIYIKYMEREWGWCAQMEDSTYSLYISTDMTFMEFLRVLGHEMVHLYQYQILGLGEEILPEPDDEIESGSFFKFQKRFDRFGIDVNI